MTLRMAALDIQEVGFMQPLWQKFARLSIPTFNLEFPPQSTPRPRSSALCFIVCSHSAHPGIKISPRRFITLHTALSKHSLGWIGWVTINLFRPSFSSLGFFPTEWHRCLAHPQGVSDAFVQTFMKSFGKIISLFNK